MCGENMDEKPTTLELFGSFVKELDALREKYQIPWETFETVLKAYVEFSWETEAYTALLANFDGCLDCEEAPEE